VTCAGHVFTAHVRANPGLVWTALTDPGQTGAYLYGLAAHSTWVPDTADSSQDAEDVWLPVLATLQQLLVSPP